MSYIITDTDRVNFVNTPQTKTISVNATGLLETVSKPDWLREEYTFKNYKADSDSDGEKNTQVIDDFENKPNAASSALAYRDISNPGITDWYLPSSEEFDKLVDNVSKFSMYPLGYNQYWTSTETSATTAVTCTKTKLCISESKTTLYGVRAIKKIRYTDINPPYSEGDNLGYGVVYYIDVLNKLIYIVSKQDLTPVAWGTKMLVANANYTSSIILSVDRNDRYIQLDDFLKVALQHNPSVTYTITVIQESSDSDSQSVMLKDIIDNIMIESSNPDSYLQGIQRYHALLLAKTILKDLSFDSLREIRVYEAEISAANKVIPPVDYVEYVRLCLVTKDGRLLPLFINKDLNISHKYVKDNKDEIIVDDLGYPIKAQGTRITGSSYTVRKIFNPNPTADGEYIYDNALYGIKGGQVSYTGSYRYDRDAKEFILDGIPSEFTHVVIEYLSDPIAAEKDPRKIRIHKYYQTAVESGIYYRFIDKMRNVPAVEKATARREYYNEIRKSNMRMSAKPKEMIQKLGADVGFNKML